MKTPPEQAEAEMLMRAIRGAEHIHPELRLLHAIPNGGLRSRKTAADLKAGGVKAGVPDYCLPVPRGAHHGLYIELKRLRDGRLSPEQAWWLASLEEQGYRAIVCRGWQEAFAAIKDYLALDAVNELEQAA
ncbi:VRR-NUC domain-containing protein [Lysobacter enzymogenes]|uniref:VRR-NUC domain-containing protein n=1 Tax=Lysobacter enzymogenes TaxID=69 RepID=UPI001A9669CE|nr:VRR-NUC domain-containing protein [Lysobacter enzymogenes]QQP96524.1 VRR-NUC domain-containing protein [Lysobacter enzymogenes]